MELKFTKKMFIAVIITIITNIMVLPTVNFANSTTSEEIPEMVSPLKKPSEYDPSGSIGASPVTVNLTAQLVKWIRNIGAVVAVLVLTIIGVKYMMAAGAEEKAQYKETIMPVVIGVVMLLGSLTLITSIASLFD